jgi:Spy/CpxP family protein refolding chaperone
MDEKVGLTSDQQEQIKKILDETSDKYREIRKDVDPVLKPFEPRFNAVRQESRDRIRALLTPEQLPKYEQMVQEHDKMREQEKERSKK